MSAPIFNLFTEIKSLPKEKQPELTAPLLASTISKILHSDNEDAKKLYLIQQLLINHGLYLQEKP
jgi:hypothetical protein